MGHVLDRMKPGRKRKDKRPLMAAVQSVLEQDCTLTLEGVSELLPPSLRVSASSVGRAMKANGWTRKVVRYVPMRRNSPQVIEERRQYAIGVKDGDVVCNAVSFCSYAQV